VRAGRQWFERVFRGQRNALDGAPGHFGNCETPSISGRGATRTDRKVETGFNNSASGSNPGGSLARPAKASGSSIPPLTQRLLASKKLVGACEVDAKPYFDFKVAREGVGVRGRGRGIALESAGKKTRRACDRHPPPRPICRSRSSSWPAPSLQVIRPCPRMSSREGRYLRFSGPKALVSTSLASAKGLLSRIA
jgi:hypothetical protein